MKIQTYPSSQLGLEYNRHQTSRTKHQASDISEETNMAVKCQAQNTCSKLLLQSPFNKLPKHLYLVERLFFFSVQGFVRFV